MCCFVPRVTVTAEMLPKCSHFSERHSYSDLLNSIQITFTLKQEPFAITIPKWQINSFVTSRWIFFFLLLLLPSAVFAGKLFASVACYSAHASKFPENDVTENELLTHPVSLFVVPYISSWAIHNFMDPHPRPSPEWFSFSNIRRSNIWPFLKWNTIQSWVDGC